MEMEAFTTEEVLYKEECAFYLNIMVHQDHETRSTSSGGIILICVTKSNWSKLQFTLSWQTLFSEEAWPSVHVCWILSTF